MATRIKVVSRSWWHRGEVHSVRELYCSVDGVQWIRLGVHL